MSEAPGVAKTESKSVRPDLDPSGYLARPVIGNEALTQRVVGIDQAGREVEARVVVERPLTLYLNARDDA